MPTRLPPLVPSPLRARARKGRLRLDERAPIVLAPGADDADFASALALQGAIEAAGGRRCPIESHARRDDLGPHVALLREALPADAPDACRRSHEAYRLEVSPGGARVQAPGAAGLHYGVGSLAQLLDGRGGLPACRVDDAPAFALRGVMLDVSRGKVPTAATLREIVDLLASLKLNALMLYTEHTFRFRRHPKIGRDDSPLDAQTLRALDAYAAARHVELIPCLQSLGHMEHVLKLPEYARLDESGRGWTVSPAEPDTYRLLADLYDEYLPNFRSGWFNANCDEPYDLPGEKSRAREEALGPGGVFLEHVGRVQALAARHGKRTMLWGDVVHEHPERIGEIPRDVLMLDWWYEAGGIDFDRVARFAENGIAFAVCPGTASWNCLFPRIENSVANVSHWAEAGRRHGAVGLVNTDWGDFGHYNLQGNSYLGFAWGAQESWSGPADAASFDRAFSRLVFGDASGEVARLFRQLGAPHDAGFRVPNGSTLQYLFFDELGEGYFLRRARAGALARFDARLARLRERIAAAEGRFARHALVHAELLYAADASLLAVRKARAALAWFAWREKPGSLGARERRALARRLSALADEQVALGRRLRALWLARSAVSNLDHTQTRLGRSVRSLRRAARALERGRPPKPPAALPALDMKVVLQHLRGKVGGGAV